VLNQGRNQDSANGEGCGDARARYGRKNHTSQDAGHWQPALHSAYDTFCELNETTRDTARLHQVTRQNKKWNCGQGEFIQRVKHLFDGYKHIHIANLYT
jgi:hypothetical protein